MPPPVPSNLPVVLFGYESSAFTWKVRFSLKIKRIPYSFVTVPSMMPRPILRDKFNITYRKIPVLAIGRDMYVDTSLILEALEYQFPSSSSKGYGTLYPPSRNGNPYRNFARGFASFWSDRPFFRFTCGVMPADIWRTSFGTDRAQLIGHKLDPDKLEKKFPQNMSGLDLHLSFLEPLLEGQNTWLFDTETPSAADISFYYQLEWCEKISRGERVADLTAGSLGEDIGEGISAVFNETRYPNVWSWFHRMNSYLAELDVVEQKVDQKDEKGVEIVLRGLSKCEQQAQIPMLPTPAAQHEDLDRRNGLENGTKVSIRPDDTGRDDPTVGSLVALSPEEIVITPEKIDGQGPAVGDVRVHFPRVGFVVSPVNTDTKRQSKL